MDQELTHHGIRGMKWGRRRYQNPDGSLTPAGRKRYGVEAGNQRSSAQLARNQATKAISSKQISKKKSPDDDIPEENRYLTKKARSMTDAEIDKAIARLQKEETFKRLSPEEKERAQKAVNDMSYRKKSLNEMSNEDIQRALDRANLERQYRQAYPEHVSAGKKFIRSLANDVIAPAAKSAGKDFLEKALKKLGDKYLKDAPDPNSLEYLKTQHDKLDYKNKIKNLKKKLAGEKVDDDETPKQRDERVKSELSLLEKDPDYRKEHPELLKKYGLGPDGKAVKNDTSNQSSKQKNDNDSTVKSDPKSETKSNDSQNKAQEKAERNAAKAQAKAEKKSAAEEAAAQKSMTQELVKRLREQRGYTVDDGVINGVTNFVEKATSDYAYDSGTIYNEGRSFSDLYGSHLLTAPKEDRR